MKVSKYLFVLLAVLGSNALMAQNNNLHVYKCDTAAHDYPSLQIEDRSSPEGAVVESPSLIMLPNGLKAIQFGLSHEGKYLKENSIFKVRYNVTWYDDCGRKITLGSDLTEGVILNPQQTLTVQSNAMHDQASKAKIKIYLEK